MKILLSEKLGSQLLKSGQYVFAAIGIVALGYSASVSVDALLFQNREAQRFAQELRPGVKYEKKDPRSESSTNLRQQASREGTAIASLEIPRIGLSTVVVEGVEDDDLRLAPGHIPGTALPGQPGNIGIAGHRDTFFRPLRLIHKDDVIALITPNEEDRYRVVSIQIVGPDDVGVLYPTSRDTLTLVTCYPFYYLGAAPKRFIVRAERDKTVSGSRSEVAALFSSFRRPRTKRSLATN
jgi:sortase A